MEEGSTLIVTVVGGQFGSEGKGAVVGHLARTWLRPIDMCIRVAGPNAGHTVYDERGTKWALRQVPAAAPVSPCTLVIAAGSEIDIDVLLDEVERLDRAGHGVSERLWVHPAATAITNRHKAYEEEVGLIGRIGSTGKGIGAARADRIMRQADLIGAIPLKGIKMLNWSEFPWGLSGTKGRNILVEGTQGYGLGLHTSYYPKVTSSDCRAIDMLAMAGVPALGRSNRVVVVIRPNPIRVAGDSGPLWGETTWDALGLPPEQTTVTGKTRRVGRWDDGLVSEAVRANGGGRVVRLALSMLDHVFPEVAGMTDSQLIFKVPGVTQYIHRIEHDAGAPVWLLGTGPSTYAFRVEAAL